MAPTTKTRTVSRTVPIRTKGEVEAAVCEAMIRFEQEFMGRGPKDIRTHLIGDLLLVRLSGVLTVAEQNLVRSLPPEKGRDLLKQVRTHLVETARQHMAELIHGITDSHVISMHHDVSTMTGEEILIFTLESTPLYREVKPR